jgi:alcohol dehydrogenase class IV
VAFALGAGETARTAAGNAGAAIEAITGLRDSLGLARRPSDFGVVAGDFAQISADALDDEVLASTPRVPTSADIIAILAAAQGQGGELCW